MAGRAVKTEKIKGIDAMNRAITVVESYVQSGWRVECVFPYAGFIVTVFSKENE